MNKKDRCFKYDELKKSANEVRFRLIKDGILKAGDKLRKKPRDLEKERILFFRAIARLKNYLPYYNKKGCLVLPYYRIVKESE